ncbi:MAG: pyridoxine 5'-phosphate synthase [Luteitalea sp.]|nr:pyridoxine 5'-phosphate synthase [Luteitalea sp.]
MRLAVNIDHIATIREARRAREPQPVAAALAAEMAGAEGITIHLRGDRRHIQERDLELLREVVTTKLNVEMAVTAEMLQIALRVRPDQVTLVPEQPNEVTTQGGLDVGAHNQAIKDMTRQLTDAGIRVSLFIDADPEQVRRARQTGAQAIEINTGPYADAREAARPQEFARIADVARLAARGEVEVLAGHGLNYFNVRPIVAIPEIVELNIGHAIVARAALVGFDRAVREMAALVLR